MMRLSTKHAIACCLALLATASTASTQAKKKYKKSERWKLDPYTKNEPKLMEKLGYVSYGPFDFGQRGDKPVTTTDVEEHLSYEQILWVETAHLKIGLMLDPWPVPQELKTQKKLRAELTRLKERLGGKSKIKVKPRKLDRWIRLHLIAQRLEDHYAEMQDWLGVKDADFPKDKSELIPGQTKVYMGQGPFLGQTGKYLIFVSEAAGTMNDYLKNFTGRDTQHGQRWNFKVPGSLIYGVATEMQEKRLEHDTALHSNLVFNLTHNLLDGYRFYAYETPVWIKVGIAHWFERRISPRWNTFDANEGSPDASRNAWKWEPETRKLLISGKYSAFSEVYKWRDYGQIKFNDHVMVWARWDYLMSQGKEKFGEYMKVVKGRVDMKTFHADDSGLVDATRRGLQDIYGLSPLTFDERWSDWCKDNYSTK